MKRSILVFLTVLALLVSGQPARAATLTVCASGCSATTIQAAMNAATSGDIITVASGTYTEQIVVNKNLTLTGAGSATTIVQAPSVLTPDPDGANTLILFTGAITAQLSGFTVQGPVNGLNFGIYVRAGANVNIHNNIIKDIRDAPLSGNQIGIAIEVGKYPDTAPAVSQVGTATITNNVISGYQKNGISVEKTGSSATITGNTITGAGPITTTAQNGIQIRRGATGTVQTNTITGNAYNVPPTPPKVLVLCTQGAVWLSKATPLTTMVRTSTSGSPTESKSWTTRSATRHRLTRMPRPVSRCNRMGRRLVVGARRALTSSA